MVAVLLERCSSTVTVSEGGENPHTVPYISRPILLFDNSDVILPLKSQLLPSQTYNVISHGKRPYLRRRKDTSVCHLQVQWMYLYKLLITSTIHF